MTGKEFLNSVTHGKGDVLQSFLDLLEARKAKFCVIGGLGVNAYAEPVVSLDLDVVLVADQLETVLSDLESRYCVETFEHSINISSPDSDLRIQIQRDERYQAFLERATVKGVLGYQLPVASIEDVFQGKAWAAADKARRPSKRQKDLADLLRLIEVQPTLQDALPLELRSQLLG